jgi:hypothetical protein
MITWRSMSLTSALLRGFILFLGYDTLLCCRKESKFGRNGLLPSAWFHYGAVFWVTAFTTTQLVPQPTCCNPQNRDNMLLRIVGMRLQHYTVSQLIIAQTKQVDLNSFSVRLSWCDPVMHRFQKDLQDRVPIRPIFSLDNPVFSYNVPLSQIYFKCPAF